MIVLIVVLVAVWYLMCGSAIAYWVGGSDVQFDNPRVAKNITALIVVFWLPILTIASVALLIGRRR